MSDIAALGAAGPNEELQPCALEDAAAMQRLLQGVDAVVHVGGVPTAVAFSALLPANIAGVFNCYEAARLQGVRRVVLASSNHVVGAYEPSLTLGATAPSQPDTLYGATTLWAKALVRVYWDRRGIASICLRIGSATAEPLNRRMLAIWISPGDLLRPVLAALTVPSPGFRVVYGISTKPRPL